MTSNYVAIPDDELRRMFAGGATKTAIANRFGVAISTVTRHLRGVTPPSERSRRGWTTRRANLDAASGGPNACWPWTGSHRKAGYGQFMRGWRVLFAHREALERQLGRPLGVGEYALHHCDNPPCCNPAHLYAGSAADNNRDAVARGRHRSGGPGFRWLRPAERAEIVARRRAGESTAALAGLYRIHPRTISRLVRESMR